MNIAERLRFLRMELGLSQIEAAGKFEIPLGSWKKYEAGPSEPGSGALRGLAAGGINTNWLLTGEGEILLEKKLTYQAGDSISISLAANEKPATYTAKKKEEGDTALEQDFDLIPFYDVEISAGHGSFIDQELITSYIAFRKDWLQQRGLKASNLITAKGRGDSMEKTIHHGDLLLIDTSINRIIDDSIYVLRVGAHTIIKRIQQALDGSLTIISDNDIYPRQTINPEQASDIEVVGRVKWYAHEI